VVTQTTLSVDDTQDVVDALKQRFPKLIAPAKDDICYATQNRQTAVKQIARQAELVLVLGSANSSNSNRLREVAEAAGAKSHLIDDVRGINPTWLEGVRCVGITAGASAPEYLVQEVINFFREMGVSDIEEVEAVKEEVSFALPPELTEDKEHIPYRRTQTASKGLQPPS
jgi:4-hydroxy-3-methylbut-2-enyl diphosphate reductase